MYYSTPWPSWSPRDAPWRHLYCGRQHSSLPGEEIPTGDGLRWGWAVGIAAGTLWEGEHWHTGLVRQLRSAREAGLLVHLPIYVNSLGMLATWRGDFAAGASLAAEADAIAEAAGTRFAPYAAVLLAGLRGAQAEASHLIEAVKKDARAAGQGMAIQWCQWVSGILYNGLGRYDRALSEAREASEQAPELFVSAWALPELIEAASRTGQTRLAAGALERLGEAVSAGDTDWGLGIHARCRALLSDGADAGGFVSRGGRPAEPRPAPSGAGSRAPALRGVAAPRGPAD
jgi:hypothetical protein